MDKPVNYETGHEISFLRMLGSWSAPTGHPVPLLDLLRGYQRGMLRRQEWGAINCTPVEREVVALIEREVILGGTA